MLTTADLDSMYRNDEWEGFGYLGGRRIATAEGKLAEVTEADARVLADANVNGLTAEELFAWANSKKGRWFADCMFGANGQHADRYLPSEA